MSVRLVVRTGPTAGTRPIAPRIFKVYDGTRPGHRRGSAIEGGTAHDSFGSLALQLPTRFEVRAPSDRLVSSAPERPCDDVGGLDPFSSEPDGDAPNFLD